MKFNWEDRMRRDDAFWNKGFVWGAFAGAGFIITMVLLIGWLAGIDG